VERRKKKPDELGGVGKGFARRRATLKRRKWGRKEVAVPMPPARHSSRRFQKEEEKLSLPAPDMRFFTFMQPFRFPERKFSTLTTGFDLDFPPISGANQSRCQLTSKSGEEKRFSRSEHMVGAENSFAFLSFYF
jgi:hypothetical protein